MFNTVRSALYLLAVYVAFFVSGAACLAAEVTWNRMLIVVVGNSVTATALIVAVFMGGLGCGSLLGGRFFGRRRPSLLPYLVLELTIGLFVLLSPSLFDLLARLFSALSSSVQTQVGLTFVRISVTLFALFLPAFLMGATFPAIISGAPPATSAKHNARTAYLYGVNTIGAATGCFIAGHVLLFELGVQATLTWAFVLYLVAAMCAGIAYLARGKVPSDTSALANDSGQPRAADRSLRRFLFVATFAVGFVALAYEVLLTRLGILYLGNAEPVFSLVLTGYLIGTGLGALVWTWLYGLLRRYTRRADSLFGLVAIGAGALVLAVPYVMLTDWIVGTGEFARFAGRSAFHPLPIIGLIIMPTALLGGLLPLAIRMLNPDGQSTVTRGSATLYALNTAGALLGAGIANHFLVPMVGVQGVVVGLTAICVSVGMANLLARFGTRARLAVAASSAVAVIAFGWGGPPRLLDLYGQRLAGSTLARSTEILLAVEGRAAMVTVLDQDDPVHGTYRDMYLNGVEEASTRFWHTQLFKLLGLYPVLVHQADEGKAVLVIAFGAGITAGSVLASDGVASLDVVDLNSDIEEISALFAEVNGDVFRKPRFRFHQDDGRNYLVTTARQYDVIVSDSTHPRAYDSWILYTEEFYASVRARLAPRGVFAQWVPVHGAMQGDLFRIHLNTFRKVFPNTTVWHVYGSDQAFLLATPEPYALEAERLQAQLDHLPAWFGAAKYQLDTVARIAGFFWLAPATVAAMIGDETRVNRDDLHYFGQRSAVVPADPDKRLPAFQTNIRPYVRGGTEELYAAISVEQTAAHLLARYGFLGDSRDLAQAYCVMPANENARYHLRIAYARDFPGAETADRLPSPAAFCNEEIRKHRRSVAEDPNHESW